MGSGAWGGEETYPFKAFRLVLDRGVCWGEAEASGGPQ